jgi:hypothetical protein
MLKGPKPSQEKVRWQLTSLAPLLLHQLNYHCVVTAVFFIPLFLFLWLLLLAVEFFYFSMLIIQSVNDLFLLFSVYFCRLSVNVLPFSIVPCP